MDIIISGIALLLIGWLLILIAVFLHFTNKGAGTFFLQERPGISGWAQCHGRNAISWTEKFKLDMWYGLLLAVEGF